LDFVTGKHRYPSDQKLPGMLHGKILRPPAFGATLVSLDTHDAEKMRDVAIVRDGNFVSVTAPTVEIASRAIAALHAEWKSEPQPSNKELFEYLKKNPAGGEDRAEYEIGSVEKATASADHRLQQTYNVSYIAHAPLEPRAALAQWSGDKMARFWLVNFTTIIPARRESVLSTIFPTSEFSFTRRALPFGKGRIARWQPRRITLPANHTWTSSLIW